MFWTVCLYSGVNVEKDIGYFPPFSPPETLDRKTDPQVPQDSVPMDVYFLLDESSNVLTVDFEIVKDFMMNVMET